MLFQSLALMVVSEVGEERRGSALGAFTAFFDIGVGLGAPPLAGATAALAGYSAVFILGALAALGTAALVAFSASPRLATPLTAGASRPAAAGSGGALDS